ncbi:YggS family pyridoxal phosphate-dependent enzyme [Glutamicibacter sp. MNS18]|uniref:YggS family pyridoxal phosphate-dependent enzyme n=1 Tax=Glutamicibacter sp. MNS18 TaxID=2989817 RepID=UPI0022355F7B|nr:YggS family pyridoxal phosphate-dependent enzyme [Glutamicibacter sp. MNS18]MCW4464707.1 YggS family pyridoxal phosphate-dependent enzyme [Glutamicibacter sp. MNS18]
MTSQPAAQFAATTEDFIHNLSAVHSRISAAASAAGRQGDGVRLLPVTKTVPAERLRLAIAAGVDTLGENKVQEALAKSEELADLPHLRYAIIGPLQRNKAKFVARFAHEFHALDSLRLAETLQRQLDEQDRSLEVYIQVNTSGEETKSGLAAADAAELARDLAPLDRLVLRGLMTMATNTTEEQVIRSCFRDLRDCASQVRQHVAVPEQFTELSMGMSGDFELAIAEGATVVRVGQGIFGARQYPQRAVG